MPHDISSGSTIAMWFGEPYNQWFLGEITAVHPERTKRDNVEAMFEGGSGGMVCTAEQYGINKSWVLLEENNEVEIDGAGEDE